MSCELREVGLERGVGGEIGKGFFAGSVGWGKWGECVCFMVFNGFLWFVIGEVEGG